MTHSENAMGGGADGGIHNFYAELPDTVSAADIGSALLELDVNVRALKAPPVASVEPGVNSEIDDDDARLFYVNFESTATEADIVATLRVVSEAIRRFRA